MADPILTFTSSETLTKLFSHFESQFGVLILEYFSKTELIKTFLKGFLTRMECDNIVINQYLVSRKLS